MDPKPSTHVRWGAGWAAWGPGDWTHFAEPGPTALVTSLNCAMRAPQLADTERAQRGTEAPGHSPHVLQAVWPLSSCPAPSGAWGLGALY